MIAACDIHTSDNGYLDGYWQLKSVDTLSNGGKTPLWLNANKYGLSSLEKNNGYLRAAALRPLSVDNSKKWGIGYGLDLVGAVNYTSKAFVHQAYAEGRWLKGVLTIGSKEYPMELKNQNLSSGSHPPADCWKSPECTFPRCPVRKAQ